MLDAHRLRIFRAVVASGSINGAATTLGYTPSAISQHLTTLQKQTGLTLIERRGRGIEPTAVGLRFAEESGEVLERLAALELVAGDLREGRIGSLTISYVSSAGTAWIPPVVATLSQEFPSLRLDLRLVELAGESPYVPDVEIYVDGAESPVPNDGYEHSLLLEEPYLAVVPHGHPLAGTESVRLADLQDEFWVDNDVARGPCRQMLLDACAAAGFTPSFHIEANDYPTAVAFVAAGIGITILPRLGTVILPEGVATLAVVDPTPTRRVMLRIKRSVRHHPAVERAVDLLRDRSQMTQSPGSLGLETLA